MKSREQDNLDDEQDIIIYLSSENMKICNLFLNQLAKVTLLKYTDTGKLLGFDWTELESFLNISHIKISKKNAKKLSVIDNTISNYDWN